MSYNLAMALKVVLTGAPGAGKSTITRFLADAHPEHFARVPEAATDIYTSLELRWDRIGIERRREVQRLIYRHQVSQEDAYAQQHPHKTLLLDRGTIDGAAYWPDGPAAYWADLGTTLNQQMARYRAVLVLETAAVLGVYDGAASNAVRFETAQQAVANAAILEDLWGTHLHLQRIAATQDFSLKIDRVLEALRTIVDE